MTTQSPLHVAARENDADTVPTLLARGANIEATDDRGMTPLHVAADADASRAAQTLLAGGANLGAMIEGDINGGLPMLGRTPLHIAATKGNLAVLTVLINAHADPTTQDEEGDTPLHAAVHPLSFDCPHAASAVTTKKLLAAGANPNACNNEGRTPLHLAAGIRPPEIIRALIDAGAKLDEPDAYGFTPLHYAADTNVSGSVAALLDEGANPHVVNLGGMTPWDLAEIRDDIPTSALPVYERLSEAN